MAGRFWVGKRMHIVLDIKKKLHLYLITTRAHVVFEWKFIIGRFHYCSRGQNKFRLKLFDNIRSYGRQNSVWFQEVECPFNSSPSHSCIIGKYSFKVFRGASIIHPRGEKKRLTVDTRINGLQFEMNWCFFPSRQYTPNAATFNVTLRLHFTVINICLLEKQCCQLIYKASRCESSSECLGILLETD